MAHEDQQEPSSLSSILGAPMWICFRTLSDMCWAATRVSRVCQPGGHADDVVPRIRTHFLVD
eukprot:5664780-Prorocentrum_lima.AAC.1